MSNSSVSRSQCIYFVKFIDIKYFCDISNINLLLRRNTFCTFLFNEFSPEMADLCRIFKCNEMKNYLTRIRRRPRYRFTIIKDKHIIMTSKWNPWKNASKIICNDIKFIYPPCQQWWQQKGLWIKWMKNTSIHASTWTIAIFSAKRSIYTKSLLWLKI